MSFAPASFLLATPRSGSTLLYRVILGYLSQTRGVEGKGEFFYGPHPYHDTGSGISSFSEVSVSAYLKPGEQEKIAEERLAMLQKYAGRYFFKVFPSQAPLSVLSRLCESHAPIYVERRNLWDQYLSLAISTSSGIWSTLENFRLPEAKLEYAECIDTLVNDVTAYRRLRQALPPGRVIVYEDFISDMDLERFFARLELNEKFDPSRISFPPKQNQDAAWKLGLFREPELLVKKYRDSRLNELWPIGPNES